MRETVIVSQPNCVPCLKAKEALASRGISFKVLELGTDLTLEALQVVAPGVRSVPQIWVNGHYVGGYENLLIYLKTLD